MSQHKKQNKQRKKQYTLPLPLPASSVTWQDDGGVHAVVAGEALSEEMRDELTKEFQMKIRQSPLWDEKVRQFGAKKTNQLLKQCRTELR